MGLDNAERGPALRGVAHGGRVIAPFPTSKRSHKCDEGGLDDVGARRR